jgi:hypothetical protein
MRRRVFIFVRGILGNPGDAKEWNARALPWVFRETAGFADNFETKVGALNRIFGQWRRARNFGRTLKEYKPRDNSVTVAAHSNGTDIVLKGLRLAGWPRIEALHLASGACESDFNANGLNQALLTERIGRVCLYRAGKDGALPWSRLWVTSWGWRGILGITGPLNVLDSVKDRVGEIVRPGFGHSSWFSPGEFDRTLKHFTTPLRPAHNLWTTP